MHGLFPYPQVFYPNSADSMLAKKWLKTDDHLLSKPERDYFSYYLDNSEFTNGFALRNIYAHGATSPSNDENVHMNDYYMFLCLLIILVLKIEDDLWLASKALSTFWYKEQLLKYKSIMKSCI